jgi:crotonobetaine/carnitine-CoA ligase
MLSHEDHVSPFAGQDVASWLEGLARRRGDHPFLIFAPFDAPETTLTYAGFAEAVARLAGGLAARGVRPGDRVLVHLENCPETLIARFACAWLGAVCVGSNALAVGPEIGWFAESTGAIAAITQPKFAEAVNAHCKGLRWIAVTETDAGAPATTSFGRAEKFAALFGEPLPRRAPDPFAPASIMFTTGTTGRPKGAVWTHANVLWGAKVNAAQQGMRADDVSQVFLPLYHVVGLSWCLHSAMWAGGTIVLQPRFSASRYWDVALKHRATVGGQVFFTLGALEAAGVPKHDFRQWIVARHEPRRMARFGIGFVAGWGMTEMLTQAIYCEPGVEAPDGVIGRPGQGYRVRVVDEDGRQTRPGEPGRLMVGGVRGLSIFREYFGAEKATAEAFDAHGYFDTGDRVSLGEDGWLRFGDRFKDVLKVGGEGVSASEIERVVAMTPGVKECAVVARPDAAYGETPVAFVVPKPDLPPEAARALPEAVAALCRENLAKFKVPREIVLLEALPMVGFGKVAKAKLREMAAAK